MKVALVNQPIGTIDLRDHAGSIGILVFETARRLAQTCEVTVYTRGRLEQSPEEVLEDVRYRRIRPDWDDRLAKPLNLAFRLRSPKRPFFASSLYARAYLRAITKDLRKHPADIVHIHNFVQFVPAIRAVNPKAKSLST